MTEIAEAYFHVEPSDVSEPALRRFGQQLIDIAGEAASGIFDPECLIEIRLQTGTLTGWVLVTAAGPLVIAGILKYKDLKSNLTEMVQDAKRFGKWVNKAFIHKNGISRDRVYQSESRSKTPGKLLRVVRRQDRLNRFRLQLSEEETRREQAEIDRMAVQALDELGPEEKEIVRNQLNSIKEAKLEEVAGAHLTSERPRRRKLGTLRQGPYQHELFGEVELETAPSLTVTSSVGHREETSEFYKRFRLLDWQAEHQILERPNPDEQQVPGTISSSD